ncbi:hypothetical protein LEN26_016359 [Aphanomyces euteiches]|nr:hypothetical protein LEN26_016359 [Aphanomyces euteiches]
MVDFTDSTQVIAYADTTEWVQATKSTVQEATLLSGGVVNYVWRLRLGDGSSVILKHFPPNLRVNPSFAFPQERIELEYTALQAVASQFTQASWSAPSPYLYDPNNFVILEEDMKGVSLFNILKEDNIQVAAEDLSWISSALVDFLGDIQSLIVPDLSLYANSPLTPIMNGLYSRNLQLMTDWNIPDTQAWYDRAVACDLVAQSNFLYGDFWPSSILVDTDARRISIIDWELARTGHFGLDMTQMMANLALMGQGNAFKSAWANTLLRSIVDAWKTKLKPLDMHAFDFEAAYIKRVVQLSQNPQWGLDDDAQTTVLKLVAQVSTTFA